MKKLAPDRWMGYVFALSAGCGLAAMIRRANDPTNDVASFVLSGRAIAAGLNPYANIDPPNLNPPLSLLPFQLLAPLSPVAAFLLLDLLSLVVYALIVTLLWRAYPGHGRAFGFWLLASAAFWGDLAMGQVYVVLAFLAVVAWLGLKDDRPLIAGLALALLVAIKPNFAVWPLLLMLVGPRRPALIAFAGALGLSAIPALTFGPSIYPEWWTALAVPFAGAIPNGSLIGFTFRLGLFPLGMPLAAATCLLAAGYALRHPKDASAIGLVVSLLASPIAWVGYALVLLPIFFSRPWTGWTFLSAACVLVPAEVAVTVAGNDPLRWATLGQVYTLGYLALLLSLLRWPRRLADLDVGQLNPQRLQVRQNTRQVAEAD